MDRCGSLIDVIVVERCGSMWILDRGLWVWIVVDVNRCG